MTSNRRRLGRFALGLMALVSLAGVAAADAPKGKNAPTHKQVGEIAIKGAQSLRHFCVDADGNVLALIGPQEVYGANVTANANGQSAVCVFDGAGKELRRWSVPFTAQAITVAPNGNVWVAGDGRIASFDREGKVLKNEQSPHVAEVVKNEELLNQQAAEQLKEQREAYANEVKQLGEQLKQLTDKDAAKLTPAEKANLDLLKQQVQIYEQQLKQLEKVTVDVMVRQIKGNLMNIRCIAASDQDLFIATRMVKGYGFAVWRMTHDLQEPKEIVSGLSGCCGQMDVECCKGCLFVAENSRKRVRKFDRDGKELMTFGKDVRQEPISGFGSCCNPMNVCFNAAGDVFTSESDGQVKRFSADGKFIEFVGAAKVQEGCKNSAIALSPDGNKVYYIDGQKAKIIVLARDGGKDAVTESSGAASK